MRTIMKNLGKAGTGTGTGAGSENGKGGVKAILWAAMVMMAMVFSGCGGGSGEGESGRSGGEDRIRVVATTGMIRDIVEQVAGEHAQVAGLIGTGVDPHLYKPTVTDVKKLQSADMVFYNGLKLEGKMGDILDKIRESGKPVVAISESLKERANYLIDEGEGHADPHIWMDVKGWMEAVRAVNQALADFAPQHKSDFQSATDAYLTQLVQLDAYCKKALATIPENQRILVTAHDAFNYLARAYGLKVRGIQGLSTESEAGVREIEELVNLLVEAKIPSVFVESSVSDKNVKALIEGAGARGWKVSIGGELFSDAMGTQGTYTGTYIGMIDHNITTITRALGGQAPELGINGKLVAESH